MIGHTQKIRDWLRRDALPLWAGAGVDRDCGGFVERLDFAGRADHRVPKRVRVQARQIYVFSHAKILGLCDSGDDIAAQGYDFLLRHACPDGIEGGFVHALDRDGTVRDARRDTYDHAFLLFAFSVFYRATGRGDVRAMLDRLRGAIAARLRHPAGGGYAVDDGGSTARLQNPHMHMFEAMLAAHEATGDARFLAGATELFELFATCMFDPAEGVLREFYDAAWRPAAGDAGRIVEPGHHYEWVWLLHRYAGTAGIAFPRAAERLFEFADRHGWPDGSALVCDALWTDGAVKQASTRIWPQTEAIKADIAMAEARGVAAGPRIDATVAALFAGFLDRPVAGGWIDWIGAKGEPLVDFIPASSFYHLFLAFSEYLRVRTPRP